MEDLHDPATVEVQGEDVRGTVFIVPIEAPLPNELSDVELPIGSLYKRLAALDLEQVEEFAFVPISGSEFIVLTRAWKLLQKAKKVAVLDELPGARYDVLFTQARREVGIRTVAWPMVADAMTRRLRTLQRTADTQPWRTEHGKIDEEAVELARVTSREAPTRRAPRGTNVAHQEPLIPTPPEEDDENQA